MYSCVQKEIIVLLYTLVWEYCQHITHDGELNCEKVRNEKHEKRSGESQFKD